MDCLRVLLQSHSQRVDGSVRAGDDQHAENTGYKQYSLDSDSLFQGEAADSSVKEDFVILSVCVEQKHSS